MSSSGHFSTLSFMYIGTVSNVLTLFPLTSCSTKKKYAVDTLVKPPYFVTSCNFLLFDFNGMYPFPFAFLALYNVSFANPPCCSKLYLVISGVFLLSIFFTVTIVPASPFSCCAFHATSSPLTISQSNILLRLYLFFSLF